MMGFSNAIIFFLTTLYINLASANEASQISVQSVYQKVRYRVRDIVGMLQTMQQQVSKDGREDAELFGKYQYYCVKGRTALESAIEEAKNTNLETLQVIIEGEEEASDGIRNHIAEDRAKRADAEKSISKAKSIRDQDAALFKQESGKLRKDIATLKNVIISFDKDDGLDQSRMWIAGPVLKELAGNHDIKQEDRETLKPFLQKVKNGSELQQREEMLIFVHATKTLERRLAQIAGEEKKEIEEFRDFKDMVREKANALKQDIKKQTIQKEELDEEASVHKDDLEDAARYLMEGRAFLPFISARENCSSREDEWAHRCHIRTAELVVLTQTMEHLTDDEFLDELFQKSLPTPWREGDHHVQMASKQSTRNEKAESQFDLLSLALKGKNASFAKLLRVFDGVAAMLGKDGATAHPEKFCGQSVNQTEENLKRLTLTVSDFETLIAQHEKGIASLTHEIDEARVDIQNLGQQVLEAGKVRKQEHEENAELLTTDNMTLQLFATAKDRLSAFYSQEDPTPDLEVVTLGEIIGPYVKKRDASKHVLAVLETLVAELRSELARVSVKEKEDQEAWDHSMDVSVALHSLGTRAISDKQGVKTELQAALTSAGKEKTETMQDVKATSIYLSELQGNNTGFLRPVVCARKPALPDNKLPKLIPLW